MRKPTDPPKPSYLTTDFGAPVPDNQNSLTAGPRGPLLSQDVWLHEKLGNFVREVIPERRMHAKGSGAFGTFTVTHDITRYTRAKIFSVVGKKTEMFARFTTVAGERGAADAERDIRGFALKFYTEEGNWDMVGNNTPVFFIRDLFRLMTPDKQQLLFDNTARAMGDAPDFIKRRHVDNCTKADPAYGAGVEAALRKLGAFAGEQSPNSLG